MSTVLPLSSSVDESGHLTVGGVDTVELVDRFGTPLVVVCRHTVEERAGAFASVLGAGNVIYAAKAFCTVAICELVARLGLGLDVCSGGELATALRAGFPPERIVFHGNNKSAREILDGATAGVGRFVADSLYELDRIDDLRVRTKLLVRVNPGVEAHTHEFIQTGQEDSKFGFGAGEPALDALRRALKISSAELVGLHAHIGSQILELAAFDAAANRLADFAAEALRELDWVPRELNLGGGFGIAHTADEEPPDPAAAVTHVRAAVASAFRRRGLPEPELFVEPGRAIIGPAAVTLYEVGTIKDVPGARRYVSADGSTADDADQTLPDPEQTQRVYVAVDGGMSDNPRHALYGARYEALLANRADAAPELWTRVVGKHCESGDVLIKEARLPAGVRVGDLLCIPATGAYTYSMASNYNRVPRPAVVLVENGRAVAIVRRETYDDLLRTDRRLDGSPL